MAIMGLTSMRDSHVRVLAYMKVFALTGISLLFPEKRAASPVKFSFSAGFSSYRMPFIVWRICVIVTDQSHVFNCRCILISKVILGLCVLLIRPLVVSAQRLF